MVALRSIALDSAAPPIEAGGRRVLWTLIGLVMLVVAFELFLQVKSQVLTGQSVFNALRGRTRYVTDPVTSMKLLRPGTVNNAANISIATNSLGLRSPEISAKRSDNSLRIAVIGASTVMGEMAETNESTFPYRLSRMLRQAYPGRAVEVINAGISGYRLEDQRRMLQEIVLPLRPDIVIAYPGFNDFADYCAANSARGDTQVRKPEPLVSLPVPDWALTIKAIKRQTGFLRQDPPGAVDKLSGAAVDIAPYRQKLNELLSAAAASGARVIIATNARAYRVDQAMDQQKRLSATARAFNPCFDLAGLHVLYDRHNEAIRAAAKPAGAALLDLETGIPGGAAYFVDSTHFTPAGEELAATAIFRFLQDMKYLDGAP